MAEFDPETMGQGIGLVLIGIVAAWRVIAGKKQGDGQAPPERPPSMHEVKAAIETIRDHSEKQGVLCAKILDMLEEQATDAKDRHHEIERQLDRVEMQGRITDAVRRGQ